MLEFSFEIKKKRKKKVHVLLLNWNRGLSTSQVLDNWEVQLLTCWKMNIWMSQIKIYISYLPETEEVLLSARVRLILTVMISKVIRKLKVKCKLLPSSGNEEIYMYINLHLTYSILAATLFHVHYSKMSK